MEITSKIINGFTCEKCLFTCCKKGDMSRHILTRKHTDLQKDLQMADTKTPNYLEDDDAVYFCDCGFGENAFHHQTISIVFLFCCLFSLFFYFFRNEKKREKREKWFCLDIRFYNISQFQKEGGTNKICVFDEFQCS